MNTVKSVGIVLAGGMGKRMGGDRPKQFLTHKDWPLLAYTLEAFERSLVDKVVLVCLPEYEAYTRKEIIEPLGLAKITAITEGGKERYHSVYRGLLACPEDTDVVLVHDGARCMVSPELIDRVLLKACEGASCIAAVPVKDSIKIVKEGRITDAPDRSTLFAAQTPQAFSYAGLKKAHEIVFDRLEKGEELTLTDDAGVMAEAFPEEPVAIVMGDYENAKITTPEDLCLLQTRYPEGLRVIK